MKALNSLIVFVIAAILLITLSGCFKTAYPDLPENATGFETGVFIDESDDYASYSTIAYNDRIYVPFGTVKTSVGGKDVENCIGYIVQDGEADTNRRIYTLKADPENNFLMDRSSGNVMMEQPLFWRALDTRGEDIAVPAFIEDLGYGYWQ